MVHGSASSIATCHEPAPTGAAGEPAARPTPARVRQRRRLHSQPTRGIGLKNCRANGQPQAGLWGKCGSPANRVGRLTTPLSSTCGAAHSPSL